jgi:hypothetical protein
MRSLFLPNSLSMTTQEQISSTFLGSEHDIGPELPRLGKMCLYLLKGNSLIKNDVSIGIDMCSELFN